MRQAIKCKQTILVTGCSSGIGLCVAKALYEQGYHVLATVRTKSDQVRLQALGLDTYIMDYAIKKSVDQLADHIVAEFSQTLYAVFHNGAYGQSGAVEDLSRVAIEEQFAVNVFGWLQLTNRLLPIMRKNKTGRIIYNSSVLGLVALRYRGAYNASKFAIEGFADTLRLELVGTNIYVSLIEPGPIESEFRRNALKAFEKHIDYESSVHYANYRKEIKRIKKVGHAAPFTLPAKAVLKKVEHCLQAKRPKIRYYVTFPTYLFGYLKRLLPARWLDSILLKV